MTGGGVWTSIVRLASIIGSDPDSGTRGDDRPDDIRGADFGTDDRSFSLRTERGKDDRIYTVVYEIIDACGNTTRVSTDIAITRPVPHGWQF